METENRNGNNKLEKALAYAAEGWPVLPLHSTVGEHCTCGKESCGSRGKHPRTKHGVKDATRDAEQITDWWTCWRDANIGLATGKLSGRLVLDVDKKHGKRGDESLRLLEEEYGPLPQTLKSVTASGGWHYVFRMPDHPIKSCMGVREGLDLLATGSYFVAPPSTIDGKTYRWTEMCEAAPCPSWLAALAKRSSTPQVASSENRIPEFIRELFSDGKESNGYSMVRCPYHDDKGTIPFHHAPRRAVPLFRLPRNRLVRSALCKSKRSIRR